MRLSEEAINEFKEIYIQEYGKHISDEQAEDLGERLLSLFEVIYKPIPEGICQKYEAEDGSEQS